jgi:hypothetical protein
MATAAAVTGSGIASQWIPHHVQCPAWFGIVRDGTLPVSEESPAEQIATSAGPWPGLKAQDIAGHSDAATRLSNASQAAKRVKGPGRVMVRSV